MVEIVGTDPGEFKRCTCKRCASILQYTLNEVKEFSSTDYGGGSDTYYYIKCPKCLTKIYVSGR